MDFRLRSRKVTLRRKTFPYTGKEGVNLNYNSTKGRYSKRRLIGLTNVNLVHEGLMQNCEYFMVPRPAPNAAKRCDSQ